MDETKTKDVVEKRRTMKIIKCICSHKIQDSIYGEKKRAFNLTAKPGDSTYRCTVCGAEKTKSS